jgi:hypothetical protein
VREEKVISKISKPEFVIPPEGGILILPAAPDEH